MGRARDDFESLLASEEVERLAIELKHVCVSTPYEEERGRLDVAERCLRQIRAPPSRDDRMHELRTGGGGDKRRGCAGARAEVANVEPRRQGILVRPVRRRHEPRS